MYPGKKEHNPPHIHALYQNKKAIFDIKTGERTEGNLPRDKEKLVSAWIVLHKDELLADWMLAQNGELPYSIEPLEDYKLEITFENKETRIFDVKPYLDTGVFCKLKDKNLFKMVKVV